MHVFKTNKDLIYFLENERIKGNKIGFVPTMGALHPGHMALIRNALKDNDISVCSIFVNPTQFNNEEDLKKYPRKVEEDLGKLEHEGCQVVYLPEDHELYDDPSMLRTTINFGGIENILEGRYRPGHLKGVGLIVAKLFNIVKPHNAYFGQKDIQQFYLIRQLIHDLSYDIRLHCIPTQREEDGLAMSSRNRRIPPEYRPVASKFYECLLECKQLLKDGQDVEGIISFANDYLSGFFPLRLEYIALVGTEDFSLLNRKMDSGQQALCIAGYIDNIRIIDNVLLN
ncbi:MAG: pantoate--beta-alanine ligase [Cyclobacteriaceae bacterium]|nr:pantoate--beta-alanine ligase [Cyclobacteriaceae bacterium]